MYQQALPLVATRDRDLKKNLTHFEHEARRLLRKPGSNDREREMANEELDSLIKDSEENHNRIDAELHKRLKKRDRVEDLYEECRDKQTEIDLVLKQSLTQLSSTYILGLQKQIERLQKEKDPDAIQIIEEEIKKTREDETYFPDLMLNHPE